LKICWHFGYLRTSQDVECLSQTLKLLIFKPALLYLVNLPKKNKNINNITHKVAMKSSTVGRGFDVGIEADTTSDGQNFEGSLPSIVNIAWDVSDDAKNTATFFTRFD
jgi:hypothetical protein